MRSKYPVFDDPFTFMIEVVDSDGNVTETLGGANNGLAAKRAYESYVEQYSSNSVICIRQKGRIIAKAAGVSSRQW